VALRLLLVRHGLSTFNIDNRIQGRINRSTLTKEGEEQAIKVGKALSKIHFDYIFSSPLQRAAQTATQIVEQRDIKQKIFYEEGLLEIELGRWSGLRSEEVKSKYPNEFRTWQTNPYELEIENVNGEKFFPIKDLQKQAELFLHSIYKLDKEEVNQTILLVAHNAILKCLIIELLNKPKNCFRKLQINNTSISIFNLKKKNNNINVQLECLNNIEHLNCKMPKNKNKARVILVRHGETDWNLEGRFQGQIDIPLNSNGIKQAKSAGKFLKNTKFDRIYCSSLSRPRETAKEIIVDKINNEIETIDELIEISHGDWEGKLESEIEKRWPLLLKEWKDSPDKVQMPSGESINQVWERSFKAWQYICKNVSPEETILIVAHDAVNKTLLCNLLGLQSSDIWSIKQGNGCVNIIDIDTNKNDNSIVTCLNLTSHLGGLIDKTATGAL
tara:strand:- start:6494 stop:7822 length:1329 start_codon:yes stop_codon:yes gene_type:complete